MKISEAYDVGVVHATDMLPLERIANTAPFNCNMQEIADFIIEQIPAPPTPDVPVKATGAEVITGTNDSKFVTPKSLIDANIHPDTAANPILQIVYPVGSYYINHDHYQNPNIILGFGTWIAIEGRFLLGVAGTYPANTTGGEAVHTLTIPEMPAHTHSYQTGDAYHGAGYLKTDWDSNGTWYNTITDSTGGSGPHNNMPPYETAYIWRRTA